jgi:hypothetical protein
LFSSSNKRIGRVIRSVWSDTNEKIAGLSKMLLELKDSFDRGSIVQTMFFSVGIKADTDYLGIALHFRWSRNIDCLSSAVRQIEKPSTPRF